jgi:CRP-like cAMP-binding protein
MKIERGRHLLHEGQTATDMFVLHEGWACAYKTLSTGRRQIISFPIPGDLLGLRSILLRPTDHSLFALTDVVVSAVRDSLILKALHRSRNQALAVLRSAARDEALIVEHLVRLGRRSAIERAAHFFIELVERLRFVGPVGKLVFRCPLSQNDLADALGMTEIHINRVLRQLRERKLLTLRAGELIIHDFNGVAKIGAYKPNSSVARDLSSED